MALSDEDNVFGAPVRKPPTHHEIGQKLDALSVAELAERMEMLQAEIARLEAARAAKLASAEAANAFFKS